MFMREYVFYAQILRSETTLTDGVVRFYGKSPVITSVKLTELLSLREALVQIPDMPSSLMMSDRSSELLFKVPCLPSSLMILITPPSTCSNFPACQAAWWCLIVPRNTCSNFPACQTVWCMKYTASGLSAYFFLVFISSLWIFSWN